MLQQKICIKGIPAIIWGSESDKVWLCVHGKMSSKEAFAELASVADKRGWQTISFDLPQHGDRKNEPDRCDIWNGIRDLTVIGDYAFDRWNEVSLFGCSLGAYFSLHAFPDRKFRKCLFQSPILDMEYLVRQMMLWFDVSEERLAREKEINTPVDLLRWDYYQYILAHPVQKWDTPTHILYGGKDNLQTLSVIESFAGRFGGKITVAENSEHPFMAEDDAAIVRRWLHDNL